MMSGWSLAHLHKILQTCAMMEGKAYHRAVRGHEMAYEALCRIKWKLWARERP